MTSVGIVGAGIGGLTLALACQRAGLENIHVYEQAERVEALGAGIQLSPNASRVLLALGLRERLQPVVFHPQAVQFRSWRHGYSIAARPLGQLSESRYGAPYYHVHRGDLQQLLLDTAAERGIAIHTGTRCRALEQNPRRVTLDLDTTSAEHDLVVGCDGIHSCVRRCLFGEAPLRFTGHLAWRGLVPAERLHDVALLPTATVWLGPRRHFVHYFVRSGELVNFVGVIESDAWTSESWSEPGDPAALAAAFEGWHPDVRALINASDSLYKWALYDRDPLPAWSEGRVTLLGDACHPMLPYLAQGAAMAIEDAWVLSRMLERWEDQPQQALAPYEQYRRPRTARVQQQSRLQGDEFHLDRPGAIWLRNLKLAFGSRYLPEFAMARYDWLHGYDCIKGFD